MALTAITCFAQLACGASSRGSTKVALLATTLIGVFASAVPARAQIPEMHVTARAGLGMPSDDYQSNCGAVSAAYTVDLQGRGRLFPQLSLGHFAGSGGGDVACIPVDPSVGTARGGLRLDGATSVGVGAGARIGGPRLHLEGIVSGGILSGRYGFFASGAEGNRATRPQAGGQVALVVYRYIVLSAAVHWTRLSIVVTPLSVGTATTEQYWSPISTLQVGVRLPLVPR